MFERQIAKEKVAKHVTKITMRANGPRHDCSIGLEDLTYELVTSKPNLGSLVTTSSSFQLPPFIYLQMLFGSGHYDKLSTSRVMNGGRRDWIM